jgi:hypothetical protein
LSEAKLVLGAFAEIVLQGTPLLFKQLPSPCERVL